MGGVTTARERAIEALVTRWAIVALAVLAALAATALPWYSAVAVDGSATLAGWGAWTTTGDVDASLRPMPLAIPVYLAAVVMTYSATRSAFGIATVGAVATVAAAILPFMLTPWVDRHVPGRGAVGVEIAAAPLAALGIGLAASLVCWIGYARCVLRDAPRAEV